MEGWGRSYTERLGYGGQPSLSAHSTTLVITWNYWGNQIQLQPHTLVCQIKTWVLVKQPTKKGSFVPKNVPGVRQGGGGHYSIEYHKKCTCVTFN